MQTLRKKLATQAAKTYTNAMRRTIEAPNSLEKRAVNIEKRIHYHLDWTPTQTAISEKLSSKVKDAKTLLFFKHTTCEFTRNLDGHYSQSQMAMLHDLPDVK